MSDNLDKIVAAYEASTPWFKQMFATRQSRILFGCWSLAMFLAGLVVGW